MTKTLLIALAMLTVTTLAPPAAPLPVLGPACVTNDSDPCQFTCPAGWQIYLIVENGGFATADCGGAHAFCSEGGTCIASSPDETAQADGVGTCQFSPDFQESFAICAALPQAPLTKGCVAVDNALCVFTCERYDHLAVQGQGSTYCGGVGIQCHAGGCDSDVSVPVAGVGVSTQQVAFDDVGYCYTAGTLHFACAAVTDPSHVVFE